MNANQTGPVAPAPHHRPAPWQPRFTILGLMLTTIVISVVAAGVGYLVRSGGSRGGLGRLMFALFILAGPIVTVFVVSMIRSAVLYFSQPRKRRSR